MSYHYKESGLDNIWLDNGFTVHSTPYGEGVSIENNEGLHRAIGLWLLDQPSPINGAELRFIRLEMELTQRDLAAILGADEQAVRRWEKARGKPVNGPADRLLRALFREYLHGDGSVRTMVERLAALTGEEKPQGHFRETGQGWEPWDRRAA
jgi:DNA-binding transcriptional regulator YiaG